MCENGLIIKLNVKVNVKIHDVTHWITNTYNKHTARYLKK